MVAIFAARRFNMPKNKWTPRTLAKKDNIGKLQLALSRDGQSIPRLDIPDNKDLIQIATISSSSDLKSIN